MVLYKYEQIVADVEAKIASAEWPSGTKLPSNAELQKQYDVSHMTVRTAITVLRTKGLVESKSGSGVYVL